jgi:hypothetical protein
LDVIEKAIRNAFDKGNAEDRAFRERVYRSAFAALDRALQANPKVTVEAAINRRKALQAKIAEIESEFIPAVRAGPAPAPAPGQGPEAGPVPTVELPSVAPLAPDAPMPVDAATPSVEFDLQPASWPDAPAPGQAPEVGPVAAVELPPVAPRAPETPLPVDAATPSVEFDLQPASSPIAPAPTVEAASFQAEPDSTVGPDRSSSAAPSVEPPVFDTGNRGPEPSMEVSKPEKAPSAGRKEPVFETAEQPSAERELPESTVVPEPVEHSGSADISLDWGPDQSLADHQVLDREDAITVDPDADARRSRRRPYAVFFMAAIMAAAGAGLWWGAQTGLFKSILEQDRSQPIPPVVTENTESGSDEPVQPPVRGGETDELRNWISVFSPDDPTRVNAPGGTSADVMRDDDGTFLRIRSGNSDSAVLFDVGQGILEQIAGRRVVFDIIARAEEGNETQISVSCNLGELGDCGRKRYAVGRERGEYLFEIDLPRTDPGSGGTIAINSDVGNQDKAVDIYEIRVTVAE